MISDINPSEETKSMEISDKKHNSPCYGNGPQSQLVQCWRGAYRERAFSSTEPVSCPLAGQNKPEKSQVICWANSS